MNREPGEIFAERVKAWVEKRGWKQVDLADLLEMKPKGLYKVLSENRLPRDLSYWADKMGVSVAWLLGRDEPKSADRVFYQSAAPALIATGTTDAQIESLLAMAAAVGVEKGRLSALRAVLFANDGEMRSIAVVCGSVVRRLDSAENGQTTG